VASRVDDSDPYAPPETDLGLRRRHHSLRPDQWIGVGAILSGLHFTYATCVGLLIYLQPGSYTWVNVAWLPGSLLVAEFGTLVSPPPLMTLGFWLLPFGSIAAGVLAMRALRALRARAWHRKNGWEALLAAVLWVVWTPVPFRGTFFYWFETY
jgi:hypothetical protein